MNYCQTGNLATAKDALNHDWIDLIWGLGRANYKKHYGSHHCSSNMEKFTFDSAVRGYHVYNVVWKPTIGKKLQADQELGNEADKFAVKVVKNNEIVGHLPRKYSRTLWYFIARGGKICLEVTGRRRHCKELCGGMEISCRLVFSCSSKVKINRLKELLESKICR